MVIIFFTVSKSSTGEEKRNFAKYLKENILGNIDQLTVKEINLSNIMKELVNDNLDTLFKINDDLMRDEQEIEVFLKSLEKQISDLTKNPTLQIKFRGALLDPKKAITEFTWDEGKYPNKSKTIADIMHKINEKYTETRKTIKAKTDDYNNSMNDLKLKKKSQNDALNLMKQDYRDLVSRSKNEMKTTDYLCTMLCFVPTGSEKNFESKYMTLVDGMVVPYSALRIDRGEDEKMQLYRVIVMKHRKDDFKTQCQRDLRITCKEYNEDELANKPLEEKEIEKLVTESNQKKHDLERHAESGYSEVFYALLHLKYLRLYVESCLKYTSGDYYSVMVYTPKEKEQRLISTMIKTFNDTKEQGWYGTKEELKENEDFYPFILIKISVPTSILK
jgi:V-type H+-transporting ATPase subunit C